LLFHGVKQGTNISGIAYIFSEKCGPIPYDVSGTISGDQNTLTMFGKAPRRGPDCRVASYFDDTLNFNLIQGASAFNIAEPKPTQSVQAAPQPQAAPQIVANNQAAEAEKRRKEAELEAKTKSLSNINELAKYMKKSDPKNNFTVASECGIKLNFYFKNNDNNAETSLNVDYIFRNVQSVNIYKIDEADLNSAVKRALKQNSNEYVVVLKGREIATGVIRMYMPNVFNDVKPTDNPNEFHIGASNNQEAKLIKDITESVVNSCR
jgi:hypothetical protein